MKCMQLRGKIIFSIKNVLQSYFFLLVTNTFNVRMPLLNCRSAFLTIFHPKKNLQSVYKLLRTIEVTKVELASSSFKKQLSNILSGCFVSVTFEQLTVETLQTVTGKNSFLSTFYLTSFTIWKEATTPKLFSGCVLSIIIKYYSLLIMRFFWDFLAVVACSVHADFRDRST